MNVKEHWCSLPCISQIIIVWCWMYACSIVMLKGTALRRMVISLLETGRHPMTMFTKSLWTRNPTPCWCLSSFLLKKSLRPSSVVVSPKFFHLISQSPKMFHLYLFISCVSYWSFPAAFSVLVSQVPIVMLSFPRIFDDAPVAYLTPPSWCTAEGAILVDPGGDRSGMVWLFVVIAWWVLGKVQPDGAYPSPGRTRGRWVYCGTLPLIWPLSSYYEYISPVMPCWHQLFHS